MTVADLKKEFEDKFVGKRLLFLGDHPWAGHTGSIVGLFTTCLGEWGLRVQLDEPYGQEAGVFNSKHVEFLGD